ncbi:MAG: glycoside hydrolase family 28 protein [Flavisolibacter sp.]
MKIRFCFLVLTSIALSLLQQGNAQSNLPDPVLPSIPHKLFHISNFGARPDDHTDNTVAIQTAINAALSAGGGTVIFPAGIYLSGPLQVGSNLQLQIDSGAILKFLPIDRHPGGTAQGLDFISGSKLHDIAFTGKGIIDGQGAPWWPFAKDKASKRPRMIALKECDKVLIEDLTLRNSPMFHIAISGKSSNVTVNRVTVRAPASDDPVTPSHNTDACDVSGTNILVENCDISTGDDNFTCGGGTSNVHITGCNYGNGHGLSIGSYTRGGVSNFLIENCLFTNTECGIRIKSDRDRGGIVQNLTYRNLKMFNVGIPILIYSAYMASDREFRNLVKLTPETAATYPAALVSDLTPVYRNISFQNITATTQKGKRAGLIWGIPEAPVSDIVFQNVIISADGPLGIYFAKNIKLDHCQIITKEGINKLALTNAEVLVDGKEIK